MRAKTQFGEYPSLLAAFAPEFKDSHFHIQGRNATPQQTFLSVIQDENYDLHKFLVKVGKGALLGAFITGIFNFTLKIQDSEFKNLRLPSENFRTVWLKIRSNTIYGAVCGAAWFFIYDKIFCPHGQSTLRRYLAAHSVGGALFLATFYHPAAIVYGGVLGLALGIFKVQKNRLSLPQNFRVQIATVSEQQKFQSRINQIEEQLSSSPKLYDNRHTKLLI